MATSPNMRRALSLARQARYQASPNPMVGAVLVRDGKVVGEGYHQRAGGPHAEILALRQAGGKAARATLYVTLEPCSHRGRTGPCAAAVVEAGVTRVVAAIEDPDPRVSGAGLARLEAAGVQVEIGDGAADAEALNRRWLLSRRAGRAFVALKFATTLDGKIAAPGGQSRWITGEAARRETHLLRQAYDAIAVGAGTVIADDPELTARSSTDKPLRRQPLRVVVDGRLRVSPEARVFDSKLPGRTLLATTERAAKRRGGDFQSRGVEVRAFEGTDRIQILPLLELLAAEGISSVLVEGGGALGWSFCASGTVDRVYAFVAPKLVGGESAPTPVDGAGFADLGEAIELEFVNHRVLGDDILLEAVAR